MKVVVINLDKSTDRMEKMKDQLIGFDLTYERFSAVNGRELQDISEKASPICTNVLCNRGMIGCALSHLSVLSNFLQSNDEYLCVMEDDCMIADGFSQFLTNIPLIHSQLNFDILSLFCLGMCRSTKSETITINGVTFDFSKPLFPLSTACYIVSKEGARKVTDMLGPKVHYHIDFSIAIHNLRNRLDYYTLNSPRLISLTDEESTMGSNSTSLLLNMLGFLRCKRLIWLLNVPIMSIKLQYTLSVYKLLLIVLLCVGIALKNTPIILIALFELVLCSL